MLNIVSLLFLFVTSSMMFQVDATLTREEQHILDSHNNYRRNEGAGLPDLEWDQRLQNMAERWATQSCHIFKHSSGEKLDGQHVGENIALEYKNKGKSFEAMIDSAMDGFMGEKKDYTGTSSNYQNNCNYGKVCGHYTQIVWKNTRKVGCAYSMCPSPQYGNIGYQRWFLVCNYFPAK